MTLFMLSRHDRENQTLQALAPEEIDRVFGGMPLGAGDCGGGQTNCDTLTVTPNSDGGWSTDCDAG